MKETQRMVCRSSNSSNSNSSNSQSDSTDTLWINVGEKIVTTSSLPTQGFYLSTTPTKYPPDVVDEAFSEKKGEEEAKNKGIEVES
ncbi:hypothetical protein M0804_010295 [Polistes exclamans]|nr:hypothetical protein M0804_010295 [Polistes exclamans]